MRVLRRALALPLSRARLCVCACLLCTQTHTVLYIRRQGHILRYLFDRRRVMLPAATSHSPTPRPDSAAVTLYRSISGGIAPGLDHALRPFLDTRPPNIAPSKRTRSTTTLLINGCGRSGTHALVALLRRQGISALHEGHGREATIGWPYAGRLDGSWKEYWPMSNQPHGSDLHDPIFKVHRHPLKAIKSIANGLTSSGACRNPSERRWDARAWRCATRFVPLPVPQPAIDSQQTCALDWPSRLRLALHYWVKWNLLADRWASHSFAVESVTAANILQRWCAHCDRVQTCRCPPSAEAALRSNQTGTGGRGERVRARRGHGKAKGLPLKWQVLDAVDHNMSRVGKQLALEYGYRLELDDSATT